MAKRVLGGKSKSRCEKGCKGRILNATKGIYCKCISKKLPRVRKSVVAVPYGERIETMSYRDPLWKSTTEERMQSIRDEMLSCGLSEYEIKLVTARVIEGCSFQELLKEQGWTSTGSANHHFKRALAKLRKCNFNLD